MSPVKRGETPPTRRERARQTRLRMIKAAHELFVERGYSGATMTDIAARAKVAVQTVYFTFHTKAELLQACYDHAVLGEDDPRPPAEQPWFAAMLTSRSGRAALGHFAAGYTAIAVRVGALDDVVRSALHEPEAVAVRAHSERLRREGYRQVLQHIAARFGLAGDVDVESATDVMLTLAGPSTFRALALDYGWGAERYERWLHATLTQQLLPPSRRARS